ncbi:MAG: sigma-54 dependent transcriptional regulator [bacterium]|nr:sigma-54 dependent transcriptional regulator [bacterium]
MKPRLLVVDDEPRMAEIVGMVLRREGYEVETFTSSADAVRRHEEDAFDLVLTDLRMPAPDGLEVLERVRAATPDTPVILFTAHATIANAIEALRAGAFDYVQKPFDNDALRACVARALELSRLARENRYLRAELGQQNTLGEIIAASDAMNDVLDVVRRAARSPATVLITGESGTGKERIARAVHFHSDRVAGPFVAVNCKAFAEGLLESELFGHERGAFTGADRLRKGLFEEASGGTLFLDEIGEISESFQAKLLRVLQEREIRRVGDDRARPVDVRVVVATNRDLQQDVAEGRFREDLFFRLAVIPIRIPPLRERPDDVLPLARHFLVEFQQSAGGRIAALGDEVEALLLGHDWPGNVRELENAIERAIVLGDGESLRASDLLFAGPGPVADGVADATLQSHLDAATRKAIGEALAATGGAKGDAATRLGIDRTTLYRLIKKYDLEA